ncbi:hypothetical protein GS416_11700 [Rhodococcus hoagii]|nr:hypothetical protein [Prescottella equi]
MPHFNIFGLSLGVLSDQLKDRIMAFHTREDFFLAREAGRCVSMRRSCLARERACRWI